MSKPKKSKVSIGVKPSYGRTPVSDSYEKFSNPNVAGTDPNKQQFEPTEANPIAQRHRMGGGD